MHFTDLIHMRLVKEGFGSWAEVGQMPVDSAMDAFHFACFQSDYQETYSELNKESRK